MIASVNAHESESVKPQRTNARKSSKAPARQLAPKVKASLLIPAEAHQRLCIHAAMLGVDRSELVTRLINEHLRRYVVQDRRPGESAGPGDTSGIGG
jgi:hypothetical protein